ncbi:MAG: hypothetical protein QOJ06_2854 [Pseudonocardiales bacterium]|jgi:hypothetical protein|nr:hypothetical protein [Pseudonocardiales bacterium]
MAACRARLPATAERGADGADHARGVVEQLCGDEHNLPACSLHPVEPVPVAVARPQLALSPGAVVPTATSCSGNARSARASRPLPSSIQYCGTGCRPSSTSHTRTLDSGRDSALGSASSMARRASTMPLSERPSIIWMTCGNVTNRARSTAWRSATASGNGRSSNRSRVVRSGVATAISDHGVHS